MTCARTATCKACGRRNHFARVCKASGASAEKKIRFVHEVGDAAAPAVTEDEGSVFYFDSEPAFLVESLDSIDHPPTCPRQKWTTNLLMKPATGSANDFAPVRCQLDSGAGCNVMTDHHYAKLVQGTGHAELQPTSCRLKFYNGTVIIPMGQCELLCHHNGKTFRLHFHVIKSSGQGLQNVPLLSASTCEKLPLLAPSLNAIDTFCADRPSGGLTLDHILSSYKDVFECLGRLPGEYHMELDPEVKPVQHLPRKVPVALRGELQDKINELVSQGVLAKVDTPTEWTSSMVAAKRGDKLRICLDPKDLNKALRRSPVPMPTIDDIAPKLTKAKVFSVMDAKKRLLASSSR